MKYLRVKYDQAKYGQNSSTLGSIVYLAMFSILIFGSFHRGAGLTENILFLEEIPLGVENRSRSRHDRVY